MLVAEHNNQRVYAAVHPRELSCVCPRCRQPVVLKRGRVVVAHFAHKPPVYCEWGAGETLQHMEAKQLIYDELRRRGVRVELEYVIEDRRADVMAWNRRGLPIAVELQHTSIGVEELETRAFSYARLGVCQIWIPFLRPDSFDDPTDRYAFLSSDGEETEGVYRVRDYEKWIHGLGWGCGMWVYDSDKKIFRNASFTPADRWIEATDWGGGFYKNYKKRRNLELSRAHQFSELNIKPFTRAEFSTHQFNWPGGSVARLVTRRP